MADEKPVATDMLSLLKYLDDAAKNAPAKPGGIFEPVTRLELLRFSLASVAAQSMTLDAIAQVRAGDSRAEQTLLKASEMFREAVFGAIRASGVDGVEAMLNEQGWMNKHG